MHVDLHAAAYKFQAPSLWPALLYSIGKLCMGALVAGTLASCVSNRAVPEFRIYETAFASSKSTVDAVLDELESVERARSMDLIAHGTSPLEPQRDSQERIKNNGGFDDQFHMVDSVYFATGATPPATAGFRRALASVEAFNTVARSYAEGQALDALEADFGELGQAVFSLGEVIGGGAKVAGLAVPGASLVSTGAAIIKSALEAGSKEAFRNAIVQLHPTIDQTLVEMRDAAPQIFELLTSTTRAAAKEAAIAGQTEARDRAIDTIDKYRVVMSNWVISLNITRDSLDKVLQAIEAPDTLGSLINDLTLSTRNIEAVAVQTRSLLGEIRAAR